MKVADRSDRLLGLLASRPSWTAPDLAAELGVSLRTIRRDLVRLRDRGVALSAESGRGGGVRAPARSGLGRLLLDHGEVVDLLLSLAIAERLGSPLLLENVRKIRQKIASAFPAEDRARIAELRRRVLVGPPVSAEVAATFSRPRRQIVAPLQEGFFERRVIEMTYAGKERSARTIEPQYLMTSFPGFYLFAWDTGRDAARTFRVDRIESVVVTKARFRLRDPSTMTSQYGKAFVAI